MAKVVIPNRPGHHEYPGVEVDIYEREIIIRTFNPQGQRNWKNDQNRDNRRDDRRDQPKGDDQNMSLLSSIDKIAKKFGKK